MPAGYIAQKYISPTQVGMNLQDIDTAADGNWIDCAGFDVCTALCFHDYAAATGVEMFFEVRDGTNATAHYLTAFDDDGGGVYTFSKMECRIVTGADTYWEFTIRDLNAMQIRVAEALGEGSPSGDKLTVALLLAATSG